MSPSPLRQKLLRILGVESSNKAKKKSKNDVPINLYTNFYFKVETKSDDNSSSSADLSVNSVESPDFEEIDFSTRRLTTENVKKVKRLHKSKSVEDWLNTIEFDDHIIYGEYEHNNTDTGDGCCSQEKSNHYACVDVTVSSGLCHYDSPQMRIFAKSRDIFQSYSSLSTYNLKFD